MKLIFFGWGWYYKGVVQNGLLLNVSLNTRHIQAEMDWALSQIINGQGDMQISPDLLRILIPV